MSGANAAARNTGSLMPPKHILNAPTRLMKQLGYGKDYAYDHDTEEGFSGQNYFPDGMERRSFYRPTDRGAEAATRFRNSLSSAIFPPLKATMTSPCLIPAFSAGLPGLTELTSTPRASFILRLFAKSEVRF